MHDSDSRKILLVGEIGKAFLEPERITERQCEICPNISDAVEAAATNRFAAITVVMSGISARLSGALKALRNACDARIVLLAQMYEEPIAIQLIGARHNGAALANDYLICPLRPDSLYESVMGISAGADAGVTTHPAGAVDATAEMRIRHLERLATEDDLTELKNRRYVWEFSRQIIERAAAQNGRVTLLLFDIDNFKHYNDLYGHHAGDEILRQAAALMKRCCRAHDVVGRIGGDEFAVIFWDDPQRDIARAGGAERRSATADHPGQAIFIAKRLVRELEAAELSTSGGLGPKGKGVLTISGGLASYPRDGATIQQLFEQADKALLEAKRSGKNRIYLVGTPQTDVTDIDKADPNT
ncbi:MAG: GGDEF domain-containing protein [Planctomycetota bacterium]|jgi:diguanylate cyclase (GGDEF)-like protein